MEKVDRDERTSWELLERIIQTAVWNRWSLLPEHGHMASRYDAFVGSTASPGATHRRREQAWANEGWKICGGCGGCNNEKKNYMA